MAWHGEFAGTKPAPCGVLSWIMLCTNVKAVFIFIVFGLELLGLEMGLEMGRAGTVVGNEMGGGGLCVGRVLGF